MKAQAIVVVVVVVLLAAVALLALDSLHVPVGCGTRITTDTTLGANVGPCSGNGLVVAGNRIVLDCAGRTINGTGSDFASLGISLAGTSEVTVENCKVTGFQDGFLLNSSSGDTLTGNTADGNGFGFYLSSTSGNTLTGNTADGNTSYGYSDYSWGSGTAGTANFYSGNESSGNGPGGSEPSGLGSPQP